MRKNITNHKHTALAVAMAAVLALSGCGSVAATEAVAPEAQTVEVTETETVTLEVNNVKADLEVKTLTEIASEPSPKADTIGYTYTDMSAIMYAKSAVNVRSLPSTDGTRLGTLVANQPVAVTGQCNETGWYRIQYGDGEAYVSNKYLVGEEQVAVQTEQIAVEQSASTNTSGIVDPNDPSTWTPPHEGMKYDVTLGMWVDIQPSDTDPFNKTKATDAAIAAAIAQFGPNIIIFDDGAIHDPTTWEVLGIIDSNGQITTKPADGFNRAAAEEVWAYVNAERTAAGLNAVEWDEESYNFACKRAQAIITNYSHAGCGYYRENCAVDSTGDAYNIHMQWHNSTGHYNNYMNSKHAIGACAVYVYNGKSYCVEEFLYESTAAALKSGKISINGS